MKKLMIAATIVCAAAISQAASFTWTSDSIGYVLKPSDVIDNGPYSVNTDYRLRDSGTYSYLLTIYTAGTDNVVDTYSGSLDTPYSGKIGITTADSDKVFEGTTYDYVLKITGKETALRARGVETDYDYTNAELSYVYAKGSVTPSMGLNELTGMDAPTTWTVSGIAAVPEPTSGLLLLLGVAGLALRRRRS